MTLVLKIRNLETGESGIVSVEAEEDLHTWLRERPRFVSIIGLVTKVPEEVSTRLRASMRPLDAEERALIEKAEAEAMETARARADEERKRAEANAAERRKEALTADPKRPMKVRWTYDGGLEHADKEDPRPITPEAQAAVLAWIAERNDWVKDRGQMVGDATVTVWPGELPASAQGERVQQGQFVPVTAVQKDPPS